MKFVIVAFFLISATTSTFKISSKEDLIKRFGERDSLPRTVYCDQCLEITVSSSGGAAEHQPNRLGRFTVTGSLWDNTVPLWKSDNDQYITPDSHSDPAASLMMWVISDYVGGLLGFTGEIGTVFSKMNTVIWCLKE